tara:strand:+ start:5720 stop:6238 length:519 start_codon:yes stop_codon:yes gene_type:complete
MAVILLRHTQPAVAPGICYGMTDLPLTASFADEYDALIKTLPEFKRIVTSPLTRCRHLAEQIAADLHRPLTEDHRFREMDFGRWESQAWDTIPRAEIDAWAADFLHARPHGGESVAMLRARVGIALSSLKQLDGDSLVVTHAGVIKVALAQDDTAESHETSIGFGRYVTLDQ